MNSTSFPTLPTKTKTDIRILYRALRSSYQKVGIVKYDAFGEMGGKLSFALTMLDNDNNGWILNSMHSRDGCYTYIKEIVRGEVTLSSLKKRPNH